MADNKNIIIMGIIGVVIVAAFLIFSKSLTGGTIQSDDGGPINEPGDILVISFYDANGNEISTRTDMVGRSASIVDGVPNVYYVKFQVVVVNSGNVPLTNVRVSSSSPTALTNALSTPTVSLAVGQTVRWNSTLLNITQFESVTPTLFAINVSSQAMSGEGAIINLVSRGTKSLSITGLTCPSTNVPDNNCDPNNKPKFCLPGGTALVDKASVCGCPTGYTVTGETCALPTCSDGTVVGQCTSQKPQYCNSGAVLVNNCATCGCPLDYYGNAKICQADGTCIAQSYAPGMVVTVGTG